MKLRYLSRELNL